MDACQVLVYIYITVTVLKTLLQPFMVDFPVHVLGNVGYRAEFPLALRERFPCTIWSDNPL